MTCDNEIYIFLCDFLSFCLHFMLQKETQQYCGLDYFFFIFKSVAIKMVSWVFSICIMCFSVECFVPGGGGIGNILETTCDRI